MFDPRVLFRTLAPILVLALLLSGCNMPATEDTTSAPVEPAAAEPAPEPAPTVEPTPEPTPATPEPAPQTAVSLSVTVTGTVVHLRTGPGTEHATDGQVLAGDTLHVTGRNADASWLQVVHPVATGESVWIYGPLTDISAAIVQTLTTVAMVEIEVAPPPEPKPIVEPEPIPAPEPVVPTVSAACTRRHTVNPNETQLSQITDWLGLDLAATAALNRIAPDTPLIAGTEICLPDAAVPQPASPAPQRCELEPLAAAPRSTGSATPPLPNPTPWPVAYFVGQYEL